METAVEQVARLLAKDPALASRMLALAQPEGETVQRPDHTFGHFLSLIGGYDVEHYAAMALDGQGRIIAVEVLGVGNEAFCIVCPRVTMRWALLKKARSLVIAHNHPTGTLYPSGPDKNITERMGKAGNVLDIPLVDHIIVGNGSCYSMAENGELYCFTPYPSPITD